MPEGLTPAEIDAFVVEAMRRGDDLYHLDEGALAGLDADLVVTQDLCAVCAVDVSVVDDALAHLGCTAEVLTIDPLHARRGVRLDRDARQGHRPRATRPPTSSPTSAGGSRRSGRARRWREHRPRVMFLEWTDPPFAPGHWIPEMIELAGGDPGARHGRREVAPGHLGRRARRRARTSSWWRRAATTAPAARPWPTSWWPAACCRPAYPCTPSTPTPRGPGPAPGWSTVSRSWPALLHP